MHQLYRDLSNSFDKEYISLRNTKRAIRFGIATRATETYAMFQTISVSMTAASMKKTTYMFRYQKTPRSPKI